MDEINDFVATLGRYPPATRVHLEGAAAHALWNAICARVQEIREFAEDLEREALQYNGS